MMLGIARWLFTVLGGLLVGAGIVLHGHVALARHMQDEVANTGFVWRALGEATFAFQSGDIRMALAMKEVPEEALQHSTNAAWMLIVVGGLIALTGPLLRRAPHAAKAPPPAARPRR